MPTVRRIRVSPQRVLPRNFVSGVARTNNGPGDVSFFFFFCFNLNGCWLFNHGFWTPMVVLKICADTPRPGVSLFYLASIFEGEGRWER